MLKLTGKLLGLLFLALCKLSRIFFLPYSADPQIQFLQTEIKRLKAANSVMKQYIHRNHLKPSFIARCRMILFSFRFQIPFRRIHLYLPINKSTIQRYISKARNNLFDLSTKSSRPLSSPHRTAPDIVSLICNIKADNPNWGYLRISIHLWHLKIFISPSTVRRVLQKPRPKPGRFKDKPKDEKPLLSITATEHNSLWSLDLTTLYIFGIFPVYILGIIDHYSRKVFCLSSTFHPNAEWVGNELKNQFLIFGFPKRIITDNGSPFVSGSFKKLMTLNNIKHVKTSIRHPQSNGKIERFFQSLKHEFLYFFFLTSKRHLDSLLSEYLHYYNQFRLHEALDGQSPDAVYYKKAVPKPDKSSKQIRAPVEMISFGSGLLKAYHLKEAA